MLFGTKLSAAKKRTTVTVLYSLLLLFAFDRCHCLVNNNQRPSNTNNSNAKQHHHESSSYFTAVQEDSIVNSEESISTDQQVFHEGAVLHDNDRRRFLRKAASIVCAPALSVFLPKKATVAADESATTAQVDVDNPKFDCLLDLPPIPADHVRIYLCRHGQTENNRLRKVQGARVDPPINNNGIEQATNMGKALSYVINNNPPTTSSRQQSNKHNNNIPPFFSSNLLRAKMTAETAANQVLSSDNNISRLYRQKQKRQQSTITVQQISSLAEVDFGPIAEGQPITIAQVGMQATAARWAAGNIDYRPSEGGDSGRDVFLRAVESLRILTKESVANNDDGSGSSSVVAVAHSTFIRILLGMVLNEPLAEAGSRKINNGSISVIDIPKDFTCQTFGPKSNFIGGQLSLAPDDFQIDIPTCNVVRMNESRHLPTLLS